VSPRTALGVAVLSTVVIASCSKRNRTSRTPSPATKASPATTSVHAPSAQSEPRAEAAPPGPSTSATPKGLAVTVVPTEATFAHYESLAFDVTYVNVSDRGFALNDHDFSLMGVAAIAPCS
jgi:hypothetical protein